MSFTMTATFRPSRLFRRRAVDAMIRGRRATTNFCAGFCVINVVLPAPRKPLKTVTGNGLLPDAFMDAAAALTASSSSRILAPTLLRAMRVAPCAWSWLWDIFATFCFKLHRGDLLRQLSQLLRSDFAA